MPGIRQNKFNPGPNPQPVKPIKYKDDPTKKTVRFERQTEQETAVSSVNLTKNSKGVNIGVKVYDPDPATAKKLAEKLFDQLSEKYSRED